MNMSPWLGGLTAIVPLLVVACGGAEGTAPAGPAPVATVPPNEPLTSRTIGAPATGEVVHSEPRPGPPPEWIPGQQVTARGTISRTPWQHLMAAIPGKLSDYLDLEEGGQTVIYIDKTPHCPDLLEVEGVVLEVRGASKRPSDRQGKVDESYSELHIDVARYRCVR